MDSRGWVRILRDRIRLLRVLCLHSLAEEAMADMSGRLFLLMTQEHRQREWKGQKRDLALGRKPWKPH